MALAKPWPHGDPGEVARSIVADPRYAVPAAPPPQRSWLDIVRTWIGDAVRALIHRLDQALGAHNPLEAAIGFILIGTALGLLGLGAYLLVRSYLRGSRRMPGAGREAERSAAERSAAALLAAARAAAQARSYRAAAALLFASAVRALDEGGRLAYDPARTPGEYRRLVRDPHFDALAGDAVVALFAAAEPRDDLFARMCASYDKFFGARER